MLCCSHYKARDLKLSKTFTAENLNWGGCLKERIKVRYSLIVHVFITTIVLCRTYDDISNKP